MRITTPQPLGSLSVRSTEDYTVRSGDSLSSIAKRVLGSEAEWKQLYEANRSVIGSNPNRLSVGMVLRLPQAVSAESPTAQAAAVEVPIPQPRPEPRMAVDTFVRTSQPEAAATASAPLPSRWSQGDVEFLARALAAEGRGELSKYFATGDRRYRDSVLGMGYVIARKAESMGTGIRQMVNRQPHFLSAWGQGNRGNNRNNYQQFFLPQERIANWKELKAIAREALQGADPTGIGPNHYYDTSISAPRWARGAGVETRRIGKIVFVDTARS